MTTVVMGPFNTVTIPAGSVVRLIGVAGNNRPVDILNMGPGSIFLRADLDPSVNDPNSAQLPANWAINNLDVDGRTGLGVIADANTKISVKVT